ncbi:hypothetical protein DTR82_24905, partial [Salmonella enterica subsp. enterica serovar Javiana]|nr:hypothetical protein [Salmonella enterica subsp. enterica serovar Javiana]
CDSGMETRCPAGAGQGQRSWPGAKHDSPGSRQGSRPDCRYRKRKSAEKMGIQSTGKRDNHQHNRLSEQS